MRAPSNSAQPNRRSANPIAPAAQASPSAGENASSARALNIGRCPGKRCMSTGFPHRMHPIGDMRRRRTIDRYRKRPPPVHARRDTGKPPRERRTPRHAPAESTRSFVRQARRFRSRATRPTRDRGLLYTWGLFALLLNRMSASYAVDSFQVRRSFVI